MKGNILTYLQKYQPNDAKEYVKEKWEQEKVPYKKWEKKSGANILQHILRYEDESTKASQLAKDILSLRNLAKSHSTYFKPYVSFAVHDTIHPTYNHCVTQTGRLSSSKPNMQNISGKEASSE